MKCPECNSEMEQIFYEHDRTTLIWKCPQCGNYEPIVWFKSGYETKSKPMMPNGRILSDMLESLNDYCEHCKRDCKDDYSVIKVFVNEYSETGIDLVCVRANLNDFTKRKRE